MPETGRDPASWPRFPCFVKPVFGKGSRDSHRCANRSELEHYCAQHQDMLIQEYLPGEEYTVDVLSDLAGVPRFAVPRARLETKDGITKLRGREFPFRQSGVLIPTFHPSAVLRSGGTSLAQARADFVRVKRALGRVTAERSQSQGA